MVRAWPRWPAALVAVAAAPALGVGVSLARTEALRASFERQVWIEARYPNAELLGEWSGAGRLVRRGTGRDGPPDGGAHCDFAAQAVYGTNDDYEQVETHYTGWTVAVGGSGPVAIDVQPVPERALAGGGGWTARGDEALRDLLERTHANVARARSFPTVYTVEVVSSGHAPWLDWRCR